MSKVECYVVHLYCTVPDCDYMQREYLPDQNANEFIGENKTQAYIQARRHGWHVGHRIDLCPHHNSPTRRKESLKQVRGYS